LEVAMERLRKLISEDGGFGFWNNSRSDAFVTAAVLRILALMQEAELDSKPYGIVITDRLPILQNALASVLAKSDGNRDSAFGHDALSALRTDDGGWQRSNQRYQAKQACELVAAYLLLDKESKEFKEACTRIVRAHVHVPSGLLARAAISLYRAGDQDLAILAISALKRRHEELGHSAAFFGADESHAVTAGALLELLAIASPDDPFVDRLVAELLRRNRDGRLDHTVGSSQGLLALARLRDARGDGPSVSTPFDVTIGSGLNEMRVTLSNDNGGCATLSIPKDTQLPLKIASPANRLLVASLVASTLEDGTTAIPIRKPFRVERSLGRFVRDASGKSERVPVTGDVRVGERLEVKVSVEGPPDTSYVLITCPIPAGFEVDAGTARWLQLQDDNVSIGIPALDADGKSELRFSMIAGLTGNFAWPSARAEAFYQPELAGRCAGSLLRATPQVHSARPVVVMGTKDQLKKALDSAIDRMRQVAQSNEGRAKPTYVYQSSINALLRLPYPGAQEWLETRATLEIANAFESSAFQASYFNALDADRLKRLLTGESLKQFLFNTGANRELMVSMARALRRTPFDELAQKRAFDPNRTLEEKRMDATYFLENGLTPLSKQSPKDRVLWLADLLRGNDIPESQRSAVAAERFTKAGASFLLDETLLLIGTRWHLSTPANDFGTGEEPIALATEALHLWHDHFDSLPTSALEDYVDPLQSLAKAIVWSDYGAVAPETFTAFVAAINERTTESVRKLLPRLVASDLSSIFSFARILATLRNQKEREQIVLEAFQLLASSISDPEDAAEALDDLLSAQPKPILNPALLVQIQSRLASAKSDFAATLWSCLGTKERASVPTPMLVQLVEKHYKSEWVLDEFRRRRGKEFIEIYNALDSTTRADLLPRLASQIHELSLDTLPCGLLIDLAGASDLYSLLTHREPIRRALLKGRFSNEQLVRELERPLPVRARALLLMVVDHLGAKEVAFSTSDPAAEYYRMIWNSRRGSVEDGNRLRKIVVEDQAKNAPASTRILQSWALSPHVKLEDVIDGSSIKLVIGALDPRDLSRVVRSLGEARRAALVELDQAQGLAKHLSPDDLSLLVDAALVQLDSPEKVNKTAKSILSRVNPGTLLARTLPRLSTLTPDGVVILMDLRPDSKDTDFRVSLAMALLDHPNEVLRAEARIRLQEDTGSPTAWISDAEAGPGTLDPYRISRGLKRYGLSLESRLLPAQREQARLILMESGASW
jgi:hypothetical protein